MEIRIFYISLFYLLFIFSCSRTDADNCRKLKQGRFYYKGDGLFGGSEISRNDSIQIVIDKKAGTRHEQRVEWVAPCTYQLCPLAGNRHDSLYAGLFPIKVTIRDVAEKYYTVNISSYYRQTNFEDTVWIVQ